MIRKNLFWLIPFVFSSVKTSKSINTDTDELHFNSYVIYNNLSQLFNKGAWNNPKLPYYYLNKNTLKAALLIFIAAPQ
jgi:hypothetical protein